MATFDYSDLKDTVDEIVAEFGKDCVIRRYSGGSGDPWKKPSGQTPGYTDVKAVELTGEISDLARAMGLTAIRSDTRSFIISTASGITPLGSDNIAIGITEADVDNDTKWYQIGKVTTIQPGPVALAHEIELAT